jgi:hypothetical protein
MDFLDSSFINAKINIGVPFIQWLIILSMGHKYQGNGTVNNEIVLTPREVTLLDLYLKGYQMQVISKKIGTELKYTYACRHFILKNFLAQMH